MNVLELKEKAGAIKSGLQDGVLKWSNERIDDFTKGNPTLILVGNRLKKRISNEIAFNSEGIDKYLNEATMWVMDNKDGTADVGSLVDDFMGVLNNMPETPFKMGIFNGAFGGGKISFFLPENPITSMILGKSNCITLKEVDFLELKEIFNV